MEKEEILKIVIDVVALELNIEDKSRIKPETNFKDDLGADSLALMELVMAIEEKFVIESIPDEIVNGMLTVQDVADGIYEILKKKEE